MTRQGKDSLVPCKHGFVGQPRPWHGKVSFDYYDARNGDVIDVPNASDANLREIGKDLACSKDVVDNLIHAAGIIRSKFPGGK
jgi:hypothetical protein